MGLPTNIGLGGDVGSILANPPLTPSRLLGLTPPQVVWLINNSGALVPSFDNSWDIGSSTLYPSTVRANQIYLGAGTADSVGFFYSSSPQDRIRTNAPFTVQSNATFYSTNTAPAGAMGNVGDYCFRTDTPGTSLQRIYVKTAVGTWTGIV